LNHGSFGHDLDDGRAATATAHAAAPAAPRLDFATDFDIAGAFDLATFDHVVGEGIELDPVGQHAAVFLRLKQAGLEPPGRQRKDQGQHGHDRRQAEQGEAPASTAADGR